MPLPVMLRRRVPDRIRHSVELRALAVGSGLIPPRALHLRAEAELLVRLAAGARRAVEIGVYEGASAAQLARALPQGAELHLIDPFGPQPSALLPGHRGTAWATRMVVARAARGRDLRVVWHREYSRRVGAQWELPVDLLFIDGDHTEAGVRSDWDLFSGHVRPGGHVVFHDARDEAGGAGLPGPTAVVEELFGPGGSHTRDWEAIAAVGRTVAVRRRLPHADDPAHS